MEFAGGPFDDIRIQLGITYDPQFLAAAHVTPTGVVQIMYELEVPGVW